MRIYDNVLYQYKPPTIRVSGPEVRTPDIQPIGGHDSPDPMMSDGGASSRLTNSGLALDSAQSSYQRFKSLIDRYV